MAEVNETIVLVHGTFGHPEDGAQPWYAPHQPFPRLLDEKLRRLGSKARCWAHCSFASEYGDKADQLFVWNGTNSWQDRAIAAVKLRDYLFRLCEAGWIVHVIAHSHGGNVTLEALDFLRGGPPQWFRGTVALAGTPIVETESSTARVTALRQLITSLTIMVWLSSFILMFATRGIKGLYDWIFASPPLTGLGKLTGILLFARLLAELAIAAIRVAAYDVESLSLFPRSSRQKGLHPQLLLISTEEDEALTWLRRVRMERNPFRIIQDEQIIRANRSGSSGVARESGRLWPPKLLLSEVRHKNEALKSIRRSDPIEQNVVWVFVVALITMPMLFLDRFADPGYMVLSFDNWQVFVILEATILVLFLVMLGVFGSGPLGIPIRLLASSFEYLLLLVRYLVRKPSNYVWQSLLWRYVQNTSYGISHSPYRIGEIRIGAKPSSLENSAYKYIELPTAAIERAKRVRNLAIDQRSRIIVERILGGTTDSLILPEDIFERSDLSLLHSCYFDTRSCPECAGIIARWIASKPIGRQKEKQTQYSKRGRAKNSEARMGLGSLGVAPSRWTVKDDATNPSIVHLLSSARGDK